MKITKPDYYDRFRCLAGGCPDSCCKEWEVQVDPDSAARYRELPGPLGDDLRRVLREEDGETYLTISDGRCPMWRRDGLCRIQAELGEAALCKTCREFPRLTHDYGDFAELGLELSCPEAARLILNEPAVSVTEEVPNIGKSEYDRDAMAVLKRTRVAALELLEDSRRPVGHTLALLLLYGCQAQGELDGGESAPFSPGTALETARELSQPGDIGEIISFFRSLEILTDGWETRLRSPAPADWDRRTPALARYFVHRCCCGNWGEILKLPPSSSLRKSKMTRIIWMPCWMPPILTRLLPTRSCWQCCYKAVSRPGRGGSFRYARCSQ